MSDVEPLPLRPGPVVRVPAACGECGEPSVVHGWCDRCRNTTARPPEVCTRCGSYCARVAAAVRGLTPPRCLFADREAS